MTKGQNKLFSVCVKPDSVTHLQTWMMRSRMRVSPSQIRPPGSVTSRCCFTRQSLRFDGALNTWFPQDPAIKTNRPRGLFPQQWRHASPPLPRKSTENSEDAVDVSRQTSVYAEYSCCERSNLTLILRLSNLRGSEQLADLRRSDEVRGGSEVTWQTVHVIIVILVALWWDGLGSRRSPRQRPLPQAAPDRHHPRQHLTDRPGDRSLADGWGRVWGTQLRLGSHTPTNKTATKTITANNSTGVCAVCDRDAPPQTWTVSPRAGSRYDRGSGPVCFK